MTPLPPAPLRRVNLPPVEPTFSATAGSFHAALHARETLVYRAWGESPLAIATPHHAPVRRRALPDDHSDTNTGYLVRNVGAHLHATGVVASLASVVRNQSCHVIPAGRGYLEAVYEEAQPQVAVELHGHGGRYAMFDVEIATRSNPASRPAELAERLARYLACLRRRPAAFGYAGLDPERLRLSIGAEGKHLIYYRGIGSLFLEWGAARGIAAYQIETPQALRKLRGRTNHSLPIAGAAFCLALAAALAAVHPEAARTVSPKVAALLGQ